VSISQRPPHGWFSRSSQCRVHQRITRIAELFPQNGMPWLPHSMVDVAARSVPLSSDPDASVESTRRPEVLGGLGGLRWALPPAERLSNPLLVAATVGWATKAGTGFRPWPPPYVGIDLVAMCVKRRDRPVALEPSPSFSITSPKASSARGHGRSGGRVATAAGKRCAARR